jgi:exodeoxyribonuclease V alpha subunit
VTPGLDELQARGAISKLDRSFARAMARLGQEQRHEVLLAAALASRELARGAVCLDLSAFVSGPEGAGDLAEDAGVWPSLDRWLELLRDSPLVQAAGGDVATAPFVLDPRGRLYLRRHWDDEQCVAREIVHRAQEPAFESASAPALRESIERLLPTPRTENGSETRAEMRAETREEPDWPQAAATVAATRRLCVITGGPGTGKTTTAARVLAVLVEQRLRQGAPAPRIALAAPTGKAAARLAEAIARAKADMACGEEVRAAIPDEAATLHRLLRLGSRRLQPSSPATRLALEVVLVDEASMVDLALMARLVKALPSEACLILLGDSDQLASVEAGSVFADLCGPRVQQGDTAPIRDCVVTLRRSHRYGEQSGIGVLAEAVRTGDVDRAIEVLRAPDFPDVELVEPETGRPLGSRLREESLSGYRPFAMAEEPLAQLQALDRFRVLCAVRRGPFGSMAANRSIDAWLVEAGLLPEPLRGNTAEAPGRPFLVTRNAPQIGLYNGDVGVRGGSSRAFFEGRAVALSRLPPHEPVFAMSVHKSQGSEFDEVALVLPDRPLPLLTRELVYTGITRARSRVVVHAPREVLASAILQRVTRASGLRDTLWE